MYMSVVILMGIIIRGVRMGIQDKIDERIDCQDIECMIKAYNSDKTYTNLIQAEGFIFANLVTSVIFRYFIK